MSNSPQELHIKALPHDHKVFKELQESLWKDDCTLVDILCVNQFLHVLVTRNGPEMEWHLSVSHPNRYPTWDEIKALRYAILPDSLTFGILLPPKAEYVNNHKNCFHLMQVPAEKPQGRIIIP